MISLIKAFAKCYPQNEDKKLLKWTNEAPIGEKDMKFNDNGILNMKRYGLLVHKALKDAPFFNRFN